MPRIIITMAAGVRSEGFARRPMLDEPVDTDRLNDDRASLQLLERICWAIEDAEQQEREVAERQERDPLQAADQRRRRDRATVGVA